jgi:hypothetical protein
MRPGMRQRSAATDHSRQSQNNTRVQHFLFPYRVNFFYQPPATPLR